MTASPRPFLVPAVLALLVLGALLSSALVPRDLSMGESAVEVATDAGLAAFDVSRAITSAVLALAAAVVAVVAVRSGLPVAGLGLWVAYMAFVVSNYVLPALLGRVAGFDARLLYAPVVFTAVYFARPLTAGGVASACKAAFGTFLYASLAAALVAPGHVIAADYEGIVPALRFRLYGLGGGASSLGAMAAGYLVVEAVAPSRSWTRFVHGGVALATLVLTQSKTSWAFALAFGAFLAFRARPDPSPAPGADVPRHEGRWRPVLLVLGLVAVAGAAIVAGAGVTPAAWLGGDGLTTLTGRTYIWDRTLEAWQSSPVFGYGVGLWLDQGFRAAHGGFAHAHNQFLHSLGSAGLVGLAGLLAYLGWAWRAASRASSTDLVPLALFALVVAQCLTEVPLRHLHVLDAYTLVHLLAFASLRQASAAGVPGPDRDSIAGSLAGAADAL